MASRSNSPVSFFSSSSDTVQIIHYHLYASANTVFYFSLIHSGLPARLQLRCSLIVMVRFKWNETPRACIKFAHALCELSLATLSCQDEGAMCISFYQCTNASIGHVFLLITVSFVLLRSRVAQRCLSGDGLPETDRNRRRTSCVRKACVGRGVCLCQVLELWSRG